MNRDIDQAIAEVEREIHVRIKCFDRWVSEGKLSWMDAFDRMERAISAIKHLRNYQTHLKLEELKNLQPGEPASSDQVDAWANQTHQRVDNAIPFDQATPLTVPEQPGEPTQRQKIA